MVSDDNDDFVFSQKMRDVCHSVLEKRGIVTLKWSKEDVDGKTKWKSKYKVFQLSFSISLEDAAHIEDNTPE